MENIRIIPKLHSWHTGVRISTSPLHSIATITLMLLGPRLVLENSKGTLDKRQMAQ